MTILKYINAPLLVIWAGHLSICKTYGAIIRFILDILDERPEYFTIASPCCDGYTDEPQERNLSLGGTIIFTFRQLSVERDIKSILIVLSLCARNYSVPELILLPVDDNLFKYGTRDYLSREVTFVDWNNKIPKAFWRGGSSGFPAPNIRMKVVDKLLLNKNSDAKIVDNYNDRVSTQEFLKYKYILIIDGTIIASSIQWTFASGSVPILITHPSNDWWFKKYLIPMVHYVPIEYDLSDLEEKIQWLVDNDECAREIAENATAFSEKYLSVEFQQNYVREELSKHFH
jgi:hypothetical protein